MGDEQGATPVCTGATGCKCTGFLQGSDPNTQNKCATCGHSKQKHSS